MGARRTVLMTGATGLVGLDVLARLLKAADEPRAIVLVRDPRRWAAAHDRLGALGSRVTALPADLRRPGLGLTAADRARVATTVTHLVHAAADIAFTQPLVEARATNTEGTGRVVELATECRRLSRLIYVSTTSVAGRRRGVVLEEDNGADAGWVNAYEQSKYEAEALVRASRLPWAIARAGLIIANRVGGPIEQLNAAHHTVRLWRAGLVPMMPGCEESRVDVTTLDEVSAGIATLLDHREGEGVTIHLCTGPGTMRLSEVMRLAWDLWRTDADWRRRNIPLPVLVDLDTYRRFEATIADTADPRLRRIVKALSSFAPALAYPKSFDTRRRDALIRRSPVPVAALWQTAFERVAA